MIKDDEGRKWACQPCITGHRTGSCQHFDSPLRETRPPGRPTKGKANDPPVFWILTKIHKGGKCMGKRSHKVDLRVTKCESPASSTDELHGVASTPSRTCCSGGAPEAVVSVTKESRDCETEKTISQPVKSELAIGNYERQPSHSGAPAGQTWQWALNSQNVDPTHSCTCGPDCSCSFCLVHLNNEATTKAVQGFAQDFISNNGTDMFGIGSDGFSWGPNGSPVPNSTFTETRPMSSNQSSHSLYQQPTFTFESYLPHDAPFSPDPSYQQVAFPIMRTPSAMGGDGIPNLLSLGDPALGFSYQVGAPVIPASIPQDAFGAQFGGMSAHDLPINQHTHHGQNVPSANDHYQSIHSSPIRSFSNGSAHSRGPSLDSFTSANQSIAPQMVQTMFPTAFSDQEFRDRHRESAPSSSRDTRNRNTYHSTHGQPMPFAQTGGFHPSMVVPQGNYPFSTA